MIVVSPDRISALSSSVIFLFSDRRGSGDNQQIELNINVPERDSLT